MPPPGNNVNVINVGVNAQGAMTGAQQVTQAMQKIIASLQKLQSAVQSVRASSAGGGGGGAIGGGGGGATGGVLGNVNEQMRGMNMILNRLRNFLFTVYVLREALQGLSYAFREFVSAGFEFNNVIEQATIGIGSLITQTSILSRSGVELKGLPALRAGIELAKQSVVELQLAGLQTAATSQDLVQAFQAATAAGREAGLSLQEIRQVTVDVVQAATAMGVPMHQLSQEVRAILEGTIDQNARVARNLGITAAKIKELKSQGNLAEGLRPFFETFREMGPIVEQSFDGAISNIKELGQSLAGLATGPLFDMVRDKLVAMTKAVRADLEPGQQVTSIEQFFGPNVRAALDQFRKVMETVATAAGRIFDVITIKATEFGNELQRQPGLAIAVAGAIDTLGVSMMRLIQGIDAAKTLNDITAAAVAVERAIKEIWAVLNVGIAILRIILTLLENIGAILAAIVVSAAVLVNPFTSWAEKAQVLERIWTGLSEVGNKLISDVNNLGTAGYAAYQTLSNTESVEQAIERMRAGMNAFNNELNRTRGIQPGQGFGATTQQFLTSRENVLFGGRPKSGPLGNFQFTQPYGPGYGDPVDVRNKPKPPPPPKEDKGAAKRAEMEERSRKLAEANFYEQTRKSQLVLADKYSELELARYKQMLDEMKIAKEQYEQEAYRIEVEGAKRRLAFSENAAVLQAKSSADTLKNIIDVATLDFSDSTHAIQQINDAIANMPVGVKVTQEQFEQLRELIQRIVELEVEVLNVRQKINAVPVRPPKEILGDPFGREGARQERILTEQEYEFRAKTLQEMRRLEIDTLRVQRQVVQGVLTQAEAEERILDLQELQKQNAIDQLRIDIQDLEYQKESADRTGKEYDDIQEKLHEIDKLNQQVFRQGNATAFFRGLNQEFDRLETRFERLGEDIKDVFYDAFREAGRTGVRGMLDTFLQGLASVLNDRAAAALTTIMTNILTGIFKAPKGGQSIFDKLIEQLLGIFGRAPTGKLSIGGMIEKWITILLDPLGKLGGKVDEAINEGAEAIPGIKLPGGAPKPGTIPIANTQQQVQAAIAGIDVATKSIATDTQMMIELMRQQLACCHEHNSLIKQQMQPAKGPGLLGQILGAMAGAAAGAAVGGIDFGGLFKRKPSTSTDFFAPGALDISGPGVNLPGIGPYKGGPILPMGGPINVNTTIITPNPQAFSTPQTQSQIMGAISGAMQQSNNMVPGFQNPQNTIKPGGG